MYYHTEVLVCIYPIKYPVVDAVIVWGWSIFPFAGDNHCFAFTYVQGQLPLLSPPKKLVHIFL